MMNKVMNKLAAGVGAILERVGLMPAQRAAIFSVWDVECFDADGNLKWTEHVRNLVTNEGLDAILDVMFKSGTQITAWHVLIFEDDYTVLPANTYAVPGFNESTAYDEATRPAWTGGTVSGQSVDNSASKATFTISATKTIYGAALVGGGTDEDTKDDTAGGGTLYCSAQFSASKSVVDNDVLKVTVTLTSSSV